MFLFSGTFFPVSQMPLALELLAYLTPIWHGVELCRGLMLGTIELLPALGHTAYLLAWRSAGSCWRAAPTGSGSSSDDPGRTGTRPPRRTRGRCSSSAT